MKYLILSALVIGVHVQADLIGKPVVRHTITHEAKHIEAAMQSDQVDEYEMRIRLTDGRYFWVSREGKEVAVSRTPGYITYQRTDGSPDYVRIVNPDLKTKPDKYDYVEYITLGTAQISYYGYLK